MGATRVDFTYPVPVRLFLYVSDADNNVQNDGRREPAHSRRKVAGIRRRRRAVRRRQPAAGGGRLDLVLLTDAVLVGVGGVFMATASVAVTAIAAIAAVVLLIVLVLAGRY